MKKTDQFPFALYFSNISFQKLLVWGNNTIKYVLTGKYTYWQHDWKKITSCAGHRNAGMSRTFQRMNSSPYFLFFSFGVILRFEIKPAVQKWALLVTPAWKSLSKLKFEPVASDVTLVQSFSPPNSPFFLNKLCESFSPSIWFDWVKKWARKPFQMKWNPSLI